jgi:hypothetical protein
LIAVTLLSIPAVSFAQINMLPPVQSPSDDLPPNFKRVPVPGATTTSPSQRTIDRVNADKAADRNRLDIRQNDLNLAVAEEARIQRSLEEKEAALDQLDIRRKELDLDYARLLNRDVALAEQRLQRSRETASNDAAGWSKRRLNEYHQLDLTYQKFFCQVHGRCKN